MVKQKKGKFYANGTVIEDLPGRFYRIELDGQHQTILGYLCGQMIRRRITIIVGDRVSCELDPTSFDKCRIVWRTT